MDGTTHRAATDPPATPRRTRPFLEAGYTLNDIDMDMDMDNDMDMDMDNDMVVTFRLKDTP